MLVLTFVVLRLRLGHRRLALGILTARVRVDVAELVQAGRVLFGAGDQSSAACLSVFGRKPDFMPKYTACG